LKIAYVYDAVYPWVKGGGERRIYELSKRLVSRGHDVHCYGMKWWKGDDVVDLEGVNLHGICRPMSLYSGSRRSYGQALAFASAVLRSVRGDYDLVDCQEFPYLPCFPARFLSDWNGWHFFITWLEVWGAYWCDYAGTAGLIGQMVERSVSRLAPSNIAISERVRRDLEGLGVTNIDVIPLGVDFKKISAVKASEETSDLIFVGRLLGHKNVDLLIKAAGLISQTLPDLRVTIIGDGPEAPVLKSLSRELELERNVIFTGFLDDYDEVIARMKSSRVFVLPSTREGFGAAALEANACGLPLVTVDHRMNAVCDLLRDGTGIACQVSEVSIAEGILRCLKLSGVTAERCVQFAEGYDWDRISRLLEDVYEQRIGE
jgi:glycosyltransferase involved in cell wall biosynthesis